MTENWRDIPGYPGYQASDLGRVRSVDRMVTTARGPMKQQGRVRKLQKLGKYGHLKVTLNHDDQVLVHHLVLWAFVGPCPEGFEARHLDTDGGNNALGNLVWGPRSENAKDITRAGKRRLTLEEASSLKQRADAGEDCRELAVEFGIGKSMSYYIAAGKMYAEAV